MRALLPDTETAVPTLQCLPMPMNSAPGSNIMQPLGRGRKGNRMVQADAGLPRDAQRKYFFVSHSWRGYSGFVNLL